jgi:serine phosphatase RsbU (regulator of sigma subunit)/lipopolysaccharide biosynthesis regulator YciM
VHFADIHGMKRLWPAVLCLMLHTAAAQGQTARSDMERADSVLHVLGGSLTDQQRVSALCQLSYLYLGNNNDSAFAAASRAHALAVRTKDASGLLRSLRFKADALYRLGNREEAMALNREALRVPTGDADRVYRGYVHRQLGIGHYHRAEYDSALSEFFQALELFTHDSMKRDRANVLNNIGNVYYFTSKDRAIDYYEQSLAIHRQMGNREGMASQYGNIGLLLIAKGDTAKAIEYSERSLSINEDLGFRSNIATSLVNLAYAYEAFGRYDRAIPVAERSLELRRGLNDLKGIAVSTIMLGNIYNAQGNYAKALPYLEEGAALAAQQELRAYEWETLKTLADIHVRQGNLRKAVELYPRVLAIKDSIYQKESAEQMAKMEGLYQAQKDGKVLLLEQQSEINELQLRRRTTYLAAATVVTFVLGLMSLFIFFAYRSKARSNAQLEVKNRLIHEQKQEVDIRNREIMQSFDYARRLQDAVMPNTTALKALFPESFLLYLPRDVVSGDFYWMTAHKGILYLAVGDCTGHGVPGAMLSVIGLNSLNRCISDLGLTRPKDVLTQMTLDLLLTFEGSESQVRDGMDIALCAIDPATMTLTFAGANNPVWIARQGAMTVLKGDRRAVGFHDSSAGFSQQEVQLAPGDVVYLFSDGFQDQIGGAQGRKYLTRRFREQLQSLSTLPLAEQGQRLQQEFATWRGTGEQTDDVCVVGVQIRKA